MGFMENITKVNLTKKLFLLSLFIIAIAIRFFLLHVKSPDLIIFEINWYDQFIEVGRIDAFKKIFFNYQPPLLYLIDIATLFRFIPKDIAIKMISIFADFFGALAIYKVVAYRYPKKEYKWIGFFAFLMLPAVFIGSSMWGQSDIIYISFLIWTYFFLTEKKNFLALLFFGFAVSFKMQAIFFAPVLFILLLRKRISIWLFFIIPVVFFLSVVPAWLAGGPLDKLLLMYFTQYETYYSLSMHAPNIFQFIPLEPAYQVKVYTGMFVTLLLVLGIIFFRWFKTKMTDENAIIFDAVLILFVIPFFLPKMHERYFFPASVFLMLLVFENPEYVWMLVLSQASTLFAYIPYFSGWSDIFITQAGELKFQVGMNVFSQLGALINCALLIGIILEYLKFYKVGNNRIDQGDLEF